MRSLRPTNLLRALTLATLAVPLSAGGGDGEKNCPETQAKQAKTVALFEAMLRNEVPSFEGETCSAPACAQGCTEECKKKMAKWTAMVVQNPMNHYAYVLGKEPETWDMLVPLIEERYAAQPAVRATLLDFVASVPFADASDVAAKLWKADRTGFATDHVLLFAISGAEPFASEIVALTKKANVAACADVRPAVFLALQGNDLGKEALARTVKSAPGGCAATALFAGLGLEKLGVAGALEDVRGKVRESALAALDSGDVGAARGLALQLEYFEKAKSYPLKSLGQLDQEVGWHCQARADELSCDQSVFALLERVTPM